MTRFVPHFLAAACAMAAATTASAQSSVADLVGEYTLASSTTVPASSWGFTKSRVSIRKLDERHVLILLACEWKREPKAVCREHYFAQQRDGGVYMQDMNTDSQRWYFDPATRRLTVIWRGADAKSSVRHDVYAPTQEPLTDPALVRRMKREETLWNDKENLRVFGHYSKWTYQNNRIEFQSGTPK
ncbi:hypothetical protein IP92_01861 [Pseudoduganella flava]|uniref:Lipoprotein n=1 Tax=Pseudoduganella flava TaxID=871742 RepID=A0A562PVI6_9BURK|nr:hypothetical protein [Pseudoduganella flava]QGZ39575.1 hypothetical protein GO485_11300 [Pseudoduganella flava]TWI48472.1 hypothetical protein IP92_01861 [Pseudoduganella flava]